MHISKNNSLQKNIIIGVVAACVVAACSMSNTEGGASDLQEYGDSGGSGGSNGAMAQVESARHAYATGGYTFVGTAINAPVAYDSAYLDKVDSFIAPSAEFVVVPYAAERYDDMQQYHLTTHSFTSYHGDRYQICASLSAPGNQFELDLFIDGVRENAIAQAVDGVARGCRTVAIARGQSVDVRVYQGSGAPMTVPSDSKRSWLSIAYVHGDTSIDNTTSFTLPTAEFTRVPYATRLYGAETPNGVYTVPAATRYRICASLWVPSLDFELDLFVNGAREKPFAISNWGFAQGCRSLSLAAKSTVDVRAYSVGSSVVVSPNPFWHWMTVDLVDDNVINSTDNTPFDAASGVMTPVPYLPTNAFQASSEADYTFCAALASSVSSFDLFLYINGTRDKTLARSSFGLATGCRLVHLKKSDQVGVWVQQKSGSTMTFPNNSYWSWLTVDRT